MWEIAHVVEVLAKWHALSAPDGDEDPVMINGWAGSCFDAAPPKEGHVRLSHLNARTFGVTAVKGSRDAQQFMWKVLARLHVSGACFADTGLVDPTPIDPMSSLKKSNIFAQFAWGQRNCTLTHGQGSEGVLRPAVGGTLIATDDALSRILGVEIVDPRGWGRFTGRILVGREGITTVLITTYFPCTSDKSCPGSAWQTQARLMLDIPAEDRLRDPWFQCLADLQRTIWLLQHEGASLNVLAKRTYILNGDFNVRWVNSKPSGSTSQQRTHALRAFAKLLGLAEPMAYLHPNVRPATFYKSMATDAQSSWIDFFLITTSLLDQGIVMEAGVLQHEQVNNSDHRLYVIDVNLDALLHLGDGWGAQAAPKDPKLQKLTLDNPKVTSEFQCRAAELWINNKGQERLGDAAEAVAKWSLSRDLAADDVGDSDWGTADPAVLASFDAMFETVIAVTVGAWRKAQNCLPSYQRMGGRRKDGWSPECIKKVRNLQCLLDISSMWQRGTCSRESILKRAADLVGMPATRDAAPSPNAYHVPWRVWIAHIRSRIPVVTGELHGVSRKLMQENMHEATEKRNAKWATGKQKALIARWLQNSRGSGPMRSTIVKSLAGENELKLGEAELRGCLDHRFDDWMSERLFQATPLDTFWYEADGGHLLAAASPAGRALRRRAANGLLTADDLASVPDR